MSDSESSPCRLAIRTRVESAIPLGSKKGSLPFESNVFLRWH